MGRDGRDRPIRRRDFGRVLESQEHVISEFADYKFDFGVAFQNGRPLSELISPMTQLGGPRLGVRRGLHQVQRPCQKNVRMALIAPLGEHPSFALFNQRIGLADFLDVLDKLLENGFAEREPGQSGFGIDHGTGRRHLFR